MRLGLLKPSGAGREKALSRIRPLTSLRKLVKGSIRAYDLRSLCLFGAQVSSVSHALIEGGFVWR